MKKSLLLALLIALITGGWILSGQFRTADDAPVTAEAAAAVQKTTEERKPFLVRARQISARTYIERIDVRGHTEAVRSIDIRAQTYGRVTAIKARKGQKVKKGDVIATLDEEDRKARLAEARATLRQRELEYKASQSLRNKGFRAETQLAAALANLKAARARVKAMEIEIRNLSIRAPFDGIIEKRHAELGDYLKLGDPVALLVDLDPILVVGTVAETQIEELKTGGKARATLPTGQTVEGKIRFIAREAQSDTRTFRVEIEVPNPGAAIPAGMSADIAFEGRSRKAHFISPAILTLGPKDEVGVKIVENGRARFIPVQIVGDETDGMWIAGLPERVTVITVGQEFVPDGSPIRVSLENAGQESS